MKDLSAACIGAFIFSLPCAAMAAEPSTALLRKSELYAFEAKQYGAAGKPATNAMSKRYARLSRSYGAQAHDARVER